MLRVIYVSWYLVMLCDSSSSNKTGY